MRSDEEFLGGYVRWFTDFPARHTYPFTVIFPIDDEITTIACGNLPPSEYYPPKWAARGIKKRLGAPYFPSIHYTDTLDAEVAVGVLKEKTGSDRRTFTQIIHPHLLLRILERAFARLQVRGRDESPRLHQGSQEPRGDRLHPKDGETPG